MRKKGYILSLLLLGVLCAGGCQRKNEVTEPHDGSGWSAKDMPPEHISETVNENFMIDADVCILPGFEQGTADILRVGADTLDWEKATETLTENNKVESEKRETYADGTTSLRYVLGNGDRLYLSDDFVSYSSRLSEYIFYCTRLAYGQVGENREVFESAKEDFAYCSMGEAEKTAADMLERIGLSIVKDSRYSLRLPHELLEQEEEPIIMEGLPDEYNPKPKESWSSKDDCYYFEYDYMINGCGILSNVWTVVSERIYTPQAVKVILNHDGIVSMGADSSWVYKETVEKKQSLIDFQTAIDKVKKKYEQVIMEDLLEVKEIELGYVGVKEDAEDDWIEHMTAIPAWVFRIRKTSQMHGQDITSSYLIILDAVTGQEIL